jgi:hypothetical protein
MSPRHHPEADLRQVRRHSIASRESKVVLADLARPFRPDDSFREFLRALPGQLAAPELLELAGAIAAASRAGSPVLFMFGGHVIKCGLGPLVADLVERGVITHLATNGSGAIHDLELAFFGATSEDVATRLDDGRFGFAVETAQIFANAVERARQSGSGLGSALGEVLAQAPHAAESLFARAYARGAPLTVHVALGAEIVHQHPELDGAALGESSLRDFRILAAALGGLDTNSVVLNVGSSVILPEVFLKGLTVARNLGAPAHGFTSANLDMLRPYRPMENVVRRPARTGGRGIALTGHHEIMIPLLYGAVLANLDRGE